MKRILMTGVFSLVLFGCADKKAVTTKAPTAVATKEVEAKSKAPATSKKATATETTSAGKATCKHGTDERTLEVASTDGGGCEVKYTKAGQTKSIANSAVGSAYCEKVVEKMKKKLTDSGFQCE